jgi:signal transduction histidine kinase/ligand-binding sensor domain-containing protein
VALGAALARTLAGAVLALVLLMACPGALALDPALDVSQYAHTAWKVREGFTKGRISSIAQTADGYLWLGTEFGLYRFDGVRAVLWQPPGGQQLPSNSIRKLLLERDGTLWIGTLKGLASWKDGGLTQYPEVAGQMIGALLQDREGMVWFGTYAPGRLCAVKNGNVGCNEAQIFGRSVDALYEDRKGNLWVTSATGLWRWSPGRAEQFRFPRSLLSAISLIEDDSGALLLATSDGVKQLVDGKIQNYTLPDAAGNIHPLWFFRGQEGSLWVGSLQGLFHLHQGKTDRFTVANGLSGDNVSSIFEDHEGSVWVTTTNGLDRFREYALPRISRDQGLSGEPFLVQASADGTIWIGTSDGLNRWANGHVTIYDRQSGLDRNRGKDAREPNMSGRVGEIVESGLTGGIRALGQDDQGRLWVATSKGNFYFDAGRFDRVAAVAAGNIWSISGDGHGNMWINDGTVGLFHVVPGEAVQQIPLSRLGKKYYGARAALPDHSHGGIWLGFYDGGLAYYKDGQVRASYTSAEGLGNGRVNDLRFGSRGTLWAATEGGLSRIRDGRVLTLTGKNGLPCDEVHWSMEDDDHFVWLYMPCGLVRVARSELDAWVSDSNRKVQLATFDSSDGVMGVGVYGSSGPHVTRALDGKIWFVHQEGVSVIDPRHLPFNKIMPPVHIEQVTADRKTYAVGLDGTDEEPASEGGRYRRLRLPPLVRDLQIDYTALSLVVPEKVMFQYKLEGFDKDWQDPGNRRQAFYTNLPPKNYRFRVKACNNSGVWNEAGTFLDFAVAPAYYQTTWFRLASVAAFAALLFGLYRLRLRQLAQEFNMRAEERISERTRIARDLHDSLLQGFQGFMFRLQAVRDMLPGRPSEAMQALDVALERGDKAIAEGRDTVADLRQSVLSDGDIAQALTAVGEELAAQSENGATPCVRVLVEGKQRELNPILRDEIYRIAREALRNAFRHAKAQKIEAEITYGDSEFLLHVRDNGSGIDPAFANQGARAGHWGLPGMRERAKSFGGKLEVWSEHGAGTEIELSVPGAIAYGKSEPRRRFWLWRKKIGDSDGQQS